MNVNLTTRHRGRGDGISEDIRISLNDRGTKMVHRSRSSEGCHREGFVYDIQPDHIVPDNQSGMCSLSGDNNTSFNFNQVVIVIVCNR